MTSVELQLPIEKYEQVFRVLEDCDRATSIDDFRMTLLESIERVYGFDQLTCFMGKSVADTFNDRHPFISDSTTAAWEEYNTSWYGRDVLAISESLRYLATTGYTNLDEFSGLPEWSVPYATDYLPRNRLCTASAMLVDLPSDNHALIGIFDSRPNAIDAVGRAGFRLLSKHVSAIARRMPAMPAKPLPKMSGRLEDVAALVLRGKSNAQIADELYLALDTVKKYVSRVLAVADCCSRADFIAQYGAHAVAA